MSPSDEEMDRWYIFWDNMVPGTVFRIRDDLLVWMKPNNSHHTDDSLFSVKNGTIHHVTEYFCLADGIEHVQSYICDHSNLLECSSDSSSRRVSKNTEISLG